MAHQWHQARIASLDFETTGPDPQEARVVQASLVVTGNTGRIIKSRSWTSLVNSRVPIPAAATAIHGISEAEVQALGVSPTQMLMSLIPLLQECAHLAIPLVIFNAPYDMTLLETEAHRYGIEGLPTLPIIDPFCIDRAVDKYRKGSRKLVDMAEHYGVPLLDAHSAEADALAAVGIVRVLADRYFTEVGTRTPHDLHRQQGIWYADWAEGFAAYSGKEIDMGWPVRFDGPHWLRERWADTPR